MQEKGREGEALNSATPHTAAVLEGWLGQSVRQGGREGGREGRGGGCRCGAGGHLPDKQEVGVQCPFLSSPSTTSCCTACDVM